MKASVIEQKVLKYEQLTQLMQVIEDVSENAHIGSFFVEILKDYRSKPNLIE